VHHHPEELAELLRQLGRRERAFEAELALGDASHAHLARIAQMPQQIHVVRDADDARALLPAGSEYDPSACFWAAWWNSTDMESQVYVVGESADGSEEVGPVLLVASSAYQASGMVGPRTVDGLGAGSTADEIRAVHPDAVEGEGTIDGTFLQVDRIFFSFRADSPNASAVTVTTLPEPPYEVCG
jgi:hypothetical protein